MAGSARATRARPSPVLPDRGCTAAVINLDGYPTIRITQEGRAVGYFATIAAAVAHGVDLATLTIAA